MSADKILIIDDEDDVREMISGVLQDEYYITEGASNEVDAISKVKDFKPNLVLLDLWIGENESAGLKILKKLRSINSHVPVVMISGHGTIDVAVQAIRNGAYDFIEKPFVVDRLLLTCKKALEFFHLKNENAKFRNKRLDLDVLSIGKSKFVAWFQENIAKIASANSRVFINSGVGACADAIAFKIHVGSSRADKPFVHLNCASDDIEKLDVELFGSSQYSGCIEQAHLGTLFLEEIDKLSLDMQRKLLLFLYEGKLKDDSGVRYSDVRLICSSNADMQRNINMNKFSSELLYRINIASISVPPLIQRREDVVPLIMYFLQNAVRIFGLSTRKISKKALAVMENYDWPGNIHQIKNVIEHALIMASNQNTIKLNCLPSELVSYNVNENFGSAHETNFIAIPLKEAKEKFERDYLQAQIKRFSGNISKTASFIGMERSALHRKLKGLRLKHDKKGTSYE